MKSKNNTFKIYRERNTYKIKYKCVLFNNLSTVYTVFVMRLPFTRALFPNLIYQSIKTTKKIVLLFWQTIYYSNYIRKQ